jgi:hypothetical protein
MSDLKPTNPKDAIGVAKLPLHFVSGVVKAYHAIALYLGNVKYGAWNYRASGARASVYVSALQRHMDKWWEGEEYDQADGTPHLANALACISILIETKYGGNLVDDRPPSRDLNPLYKEMEGIMERIKAQYPDRTPRHYTIADTPPTDAERLASIETRFGSLPERSRST